MSVLKQQEEGNDMDSPVRSTQHPSRSLVIPECELIYSVHFYPGINCIVLKMSYFLLQQFKHSFGGCKKMVVGP